MDVSDPANPVSVNEIGLPFAGNIGETTRELRVWPQAHILIVLSFVCSDALHACAGASVTPRFRFFDISDPADPTFVSEYVPRQANGNIRLPHEFYLWVDPLDPDRVLMWVSTPAGSLNPDIANLLIVDISAVPAGGQPALIAQGNWNDQFPAGASASLHSMTPTADGRRTHLAYLRGYFLVLDTRKIAENVLTAGVVESLNDDLLTPPANRPTWENANPGHSAVPFPGRPFSFVTDEVYGTFNGPAQGCPWGWARTINVAQPRRPHIMGEYLLPENACPAPSEADQRFTSFSSHNPTLTRNLALVSWHAGGLQAIDIEDPGALTQGGWYSPAPLTAVATEDPALSSGDTKVVMWSYPIVKDGLIYVIDVRNGLYILRYTGPRADEVSQLEFLEGNSNLGDAVRLSKSAG